MHRPMLREGLRICSWSEIEEAAELYPGPYQEGWV